MDAGAHELLDGELVLQTGSDASDVESLMCLLRSQIKQAGLHSLLDPAIAPAAPWPAASVDSLSGSISGAGIAIWVEDAPAHEPGSGTLEVLRFALRDSRFPIDLALC